MVTQIRSIDDLLFILSKVKKIDSKEYQALCPAHNDKVPSLHVRRNENKILLSCKAGCTNENIVKALGLTMADLFLDHSPPPDKKIVTTYPYHDANGKTIYEVVRYEPKCFKQRRPDGKGGYLWNVEEITPVLYHLPDILTAVKCGDTIYITEGEKDCDRLWYLGLVATTNPMGAGTWRAEYSEVLKEANIVVIPDNDKPGREHANNVAQSLYDKVKSLKVVELEEGRDISDWIDMGHTIAEFETLVNNTPPYSRVNTYICMKGTSVPLDTKGTDKGTEIGTSLSNGFEKGDNLSQRIQEWLEGTTGWWTNADLDYELGINKQNDKDNRKKILQRLAEKGIIENSPKSNRLHRFVNTRGEKLDYKLAKKKTILPLKWPFGLEKYCDVYGGNTMVVAGSPDAGKTAFLLNFIRLNQDKFPIYYFCSEMGESELSNRLQNFEGIGINDWTFEAIERSSNFADVVREDCINIVDYMEISTDLYLVADYLKAIQEKLGTGIAIVALQKKVGARLGRGAEFSLEKPRLYLSMDNSKLTIIKAKNWHDKTQNPNNRKWTFKLLAGCNFVNILKCEDVD